MHGSARSRRQSALRQDLKRARHALPGQDTPPSAVHCGAELDRRTPDHAAGAGSGRFRADPEDVASARSAARAHAEVGECCPDQGRRQRGLRRAVGVERQRGQQRREGGGASCRARGGAHPATRTARPVGRNPAQPRGIPALWRHLGAPADPACASPRSPTRAGPLAMARRRDAGAALAAAPAKRCSGSPGPTGSSRAPRRSSWAG